MAKARRKDGPKILLLDIETAPIEAYVWGLWDNNVALNQIQSDWHVLSWAAKWLDDPDSKIMYMSQRNARNMKDDRTILKAIWKLMDQADIIIYQNGRSFDQKKLQARFVLLGMDPPSSFKNIDTKLLASKHFAFSSNKLEYMTDKLCKKYKKMKHGKFPGMELWVECLKGNPEAWDEMEKYNKYDILSLQELYWILVRWDDRINFSLYYDDPENHRCKCGSVEFKKQGWHYTGIGKFQRYRCKGCGAETRDRTNVIPLDTRRKLRIGTPR